MLHKITRPYPRMWHFLQLLCQFMFSWGAFLKKKSGRGRWYVYTFAPTSVRTWKNILDHNALFSPPTETPTWFLVVLCPNPHKQFRWFGVRRKEFAHFVVIQVEVFVDIPFVWKVFPGDLIDPDVGNIQFDGLRNANGIVGRRAAQQTKKCISICSFRTEC